MTRINLGIAPKSLTDSMLLAEHREIKRICSLFSDRLKKNKFDDIPEKFTLGKGHVLYFLDKGAETFIRYQEIFHECINRGFKVSNYSSSWNEYLKHPDYFKMVDPKHIPEAYKLCKMRIWKRLEETKQQQKIYGVDITKHTAKNNIDIDLFHSGYPISM